MCSVGLVKRVRLIDTKNLDVGDFQLPSERFREIYIGPLNLYVILTLNLNQLNHALEK